MTWCHSFATEIERPTDGLEELVDHRLRAGCYQLWVDERPGSLACATSPIAGVAAVRTVYTPPDRRGHGYANANVAALTRSIRESGSRAMLYTDLANPTSNAIFARIGYRPVSEHLQYRFG